MHSSEMAVARMSLATCGISASPGYRSAHPGFAAHLLFILNYSPNLAKSLKRGLWDGGIIGRLGSIAFGERGSQLRIHSRSVE
jgi:hypothetical protein